MISSQWEVQESNTKIAVTKQIGPIAIAFILFFTLLIFRLGPIYSLSPSVTHLLTLYFSLSISLRVYHTSILPFLPQG